MSQYRAIYKSHCGSEFKLDLLARSLSHATQSAAELIPTTAVLTRVYHNPDWS